MGLLLVFGIVSSASAHHSMERFDTTKSSTVAGLVKRVEWINPHVYIYIQQISEDNKVVEWEIEGFPPAVMRRLGWSRETLSAGDAISVTGSPHKDGNIKSIYPATIDRAEESLLGTLAFLVTINKVDEVEQGATSLAGLWVTHLEMEQMIKFVAPKNLDLTDAGVASIDTFDEPTMLPGLKCIHSPAPMSMLYPDVKKVQISEREVVIQSEAEGAKRVINLSPHNTDYPTPSVQGHSIGQWEDDTLVVTTTNFEIHRAGNGAGLASSHEKKIKEWLRLSDDGKQINYRYEMTDPQYFASPISGHGKWIYQPNATFQPETCDMENARKFTE
jgi:hypothetical protein